MLPYSPERIVGGFNRNEPEINQHIYDFFLPIVTRAIREKIGKSPDLDRLVFEVFVKFWSHKKPFRVFKDLRDYINVSALHVWTDYMKKQEKQKKEKFIPGGFSHFLFLQSSDGLVRRASEAYLFELIYREADKLSDKTKAVFKMHHKERLPVDEIAQKLDMSEKTVKNHLSTAKSILKTKFKDKSTGEQAFIMFLLLNFLHDKF